MWKGVSGKEGEGSEKRECVRGKVLKEGGGKEKGKGGRGVI